MFMNVTAGFEDCCFERACQTLSQRRRSAARDDFCRQCRSAVAARLPEGAAIHEAQRLRLDGLTAGVLTFSKEKRPQVRAPGQEGSAGLDGKSRRKQPVGNVEIAPAQTIEMQNAGVAEAGCRGFVRALGSEAAELIERDDRLQMGFVVPHGSSRGSGQARRAPRVAARRQCCRRVPLQRPAAGCSR